MGTNLTGAGTSQATPPPEDSPYNTEQSSGLFDITNPVLNQNITVYDDYLYNAYLYPTDKKEALAYLDSSGPLPNRYARVVVVRGSVPDVMEYKVGCQHFYLHPHSCCFAATNQVSCLLAIIVSYVSVAA